MRIGVHARVTGRRDNAVDELIDAGQRAKDHGVAMWLSQGSVFDSMTALAIVGREVPGLQLGTDVVPTFPRHPIVMAAQALTVQAAVGNRFTLGIGLSHQVVIEGSYGIPFVRTTRHMREYLELLVPMLNGGTPNVEGELLTARVNAPMKVAGATAPRVLVAALGTQMLRLAGELADGTSLWMVGPRTLADHVMPTITAAAEAAGRVSPEIQVGLPVCVTDDPVTARHEAAVQYGFYNQLPSYRAMLDREGAEQPADLAVIGDEATVKAALTRLADLGATSLSAQLFGTAAEQQRTLELFADLGPVRTI